ncbi:MAG: endo-1,4-beta-xylanase, partial [Cyclobacteriaceae bacterium]
MQNRREFLLNLGTLSLAVSACKTVAINTVSPAGEEWKQDLTGIKSASGNYWLTPELKAQTEEEINKNRNGQLQLRLTDRQGNSLAGYKVKLVLQNHEFDWGFSGARTICEQSPSDNKVTEKVRELFNCTTAKCYWAERWHQPIELEEGNRITSRFTGEIDWGMANGLRIKGHPLVWTVRKAIPTWMDKYPYARQLKIMEDHVRDLIRVGKGVTRWDLCNEMLWEPS